MSAGSLENSLQGASKPPWILPLMQGSNHESRQNHEDRETSDRDEAFVILRSIDLLPDDQWQPCLEHIRHLIHRRNDKCSFLIVIRADFVRPGHT